MVGVYDIFQGKFADRLNHFSKHNVTDLPFDEYFSFTEEEVKKLIKDCLPL